MSLESQIGYQGYSFQMTTPPCPIFSQKQGGASGIWGHFIQKFLDIFNIICNIFKLKFFHTFMRITYK
eukprot:UN05042